MGGLRNRPGRFHGGNQRVGLGVTIQGPEQEAYLAGVSVQYSRGETEPSSPPAATPTGGTEAPRRQPTGRTEAEGPPLKVRIIGSEPMPESDFGQEL